MKKLLLTALLSSACVGSAFAASVPVTSIQNHESIVQLDYSVTQHNNIDLKDEGPNIAVPFKHVYGAAVQTAVNDRWAVQYTYTPVAKSRITVIPNPSTEAHFDQDIVSHQLQGIYKYNDHVNVYAGLDTSKYTVSIYGHDAKGAHNEKHTTSRVGVSAGVIGHTQIANNTTLFGQVGIGTVNSYNAKVGVTYDVNKNLGVSTFYDVAKYNFKPTSDFKIPAKHHGLNVAVSYKF